MTSLRFFAAFAVVVYHAGVYFTGNYWVLRSTQYGFTGVAFFFVLSGFVLTWARNENDTPTRFYWRRFSRIYPLHAAMFLVAWYVLDARFTNPAAIERSLLLVQSWWPDEQIAGSFNGVSWTLACEAFFYFLFPFVVPILKRLPTPAILAFVVTTFVASSVVSLALWHARPQIALIVSDKNPLMRLPEFLLGIALALIMQRGWRCRISVPLASLGVIGALALVSARFAAGYRLPYLNFVSTFMVPWFGLLIVSAASAELRGKTKVLSSRPLAFLGGASFALYMVHYVPGLYLRRYVPFSAHLSVNLALLALYAGACIVVASLVFVVYERPVERLLRRVLPGRRRAQIAIPERSEQRA